MPSYCCFFDPAFSNEDRELSDLCATCGRPFGFPLSVPPKRILDYEVVEPVRRGFYGATYLCTHGNLKSRRWLLKVIPTSLYSHFGKDFAAECQAHADLAEGLDHVVDIVDYQDDLVLFGDAELECHIAVMEYVDGTPLSEFAATASAASLGQIAIDLFRILQELEQKQRYHNDLHANNIIVQQVPPESRRADAIDGTIRAVAIDLGSVADRSKSADRLGDWQSIAKHLFEFVDRLMEFPTDGSTEYRLAAALDDIGNMLQAEAENQRAPDFGDFISKTREAMTFVSSPWRPPGSLRQFGEAYNAQTLHWWYVPRLFVDPSGEWIPAISASGPQLITGMRGCGKTILLKALEFHSRLADLEQEPDTLRSRIADERFVGLYVSANRLLDRLGERDAVPQEPYARLLVAYAREAMRAVRHLGEVDSSFVHRDYFKRIGRLIAEYLTDADEALEANTEADLDRCLQRMLFSLGRGEGEYGLAVHPTIAFPDLADVVREASPVWANSTVLFLLDDVSTRHLGITAIGELASTLLFQSQTCAFKMTTETQTLEEILRSPGLIERARPGRDYEIFDLGAKVNEQLALRGPQFIARVLAQRAVQYAPYAANPEALLGDVSLVQLAREIRSLGSSDARKKEIYRGISALTKVCVGDVGDVISLYDTMLMDMTRRGMNTISPEIQSRAYQDYSSKRLYQLNRHDGRLRDFAITFADAAHELLMKSDGARIRQYTKLYVRLTAGDKNRQFQQLRELIDAGVFVLEGGTDTPRTKTRDANPMEQFILTYRKLFGLRSFIGLSDRDRFELSGTQLQEWLDHPEKGKEILLRNLKPIQANATDRDQSDDATETTATAAPAAVQPLLMPLVQTHHPEPAADQLPTRAPSSKAVSELDMKALQVDTLVAGLGFEERTLESLKRTLALVRPARATLIAYPEPGHATEMMRVIESVVPKVEVIDYRAFHPGSLGPVNGVTLVDVTGLAKPIIFDAIRSSLISSGRTWVTHTEATRYYPLTEDIERIFGKFADEDAWSQLESFDSVWSGEEGPYEFEKLLPSQSDESRRRLLIASASPKHQRLLSLLDNRDYDHVDILTPPLHDSARSRLASLAADVAVKGLEGSAISEVDSNDLAGTLELVSQYFQQWFVRQGYEFEVGLTGSKLHAVAFAAACAAFPVSQCWYVKPRRFDPERFTEGVGPTEYFQITIRNG